MLLLSWACGLSSTKRFKTCANASKNLDKVFSKKHAYANSHDPLSLYLLLFHVTTQSKCLQVSLHMLKCFVIFDPFQRCVGCGKRFWLLFLLIKWVFAFLCKNFSCQRKTYGDVFRTLSSIKDRAFGYNS